MECFHIQCQGTRAHAKYQKLHLCTTANTYKQCVMLFQFLWSKSCQHSHPGSGYSQFMHCIVSASLVSGYVPAITCQLVSAFDTVSKFISEGDRLAAVRSSLLQWNSELNIKSEYYKKYCMNKHLLTYTQISTVSPSIIRSLKTVDLGTFRCCLSLSDHYLVHVSQLVIAHNWLLCIF